MPYNLSTLENGCKELGIELSQKQKDQFIQFYEYLVEKNYESDRNYRIRGSADKAFSRQPVLRKSD